MDAQAIVDTIPDEQLATYSRAVRDRVMAGDESPETVAILRALNERESREPLLVTIKRGVSGPLLPVVGIILVAAFLGYGAARWNHPHRIQRRARRKRRKQYA